jgi:hypothetical protein
VRTRAIPDEECVGRIIGKLGLDDLAMREVHGARHMAAGEKCGATHVEQDKIHSEPITGFKRRVYVGTICFE